MPAGDASLYDISPLNNTSSPRLFWKGRESPNHLAKGAENRMPYDPESSYFPTRRPSLEDVKRASRVKNNASMFRDTEYDTANVNVPQRPLAADRTPNRDSQMHIAKSKFVDEEDAACIPRPISPSKDQPSPGKSSLSKGSRYGKGFDPSHDIWSEYDSAAYGKSVKFDAAPPQVNEYEMRTPDPSSIASGSREHSYDSEEDADVSFEHESSVERDDSFDASLEDIEKTPVVLPEDWRFMSPESGNEEDDSFVEHTDNEVTDERPVSRGGGLKQPFSGRISGFQRRAPSTTTAAIGCTHVLVWVATNLPREIGRHLRTWQWQSAGSAFSSPPRILQQVWHQWCDVVGG
jgi:hypothetical protein